MFPTGLTSSSVECGTRNSLKRVVGGQDTQVNEYPWMVGLKKSGSKERFQ